MFKNKKVIIAVGREELSPQEAQAVTGCRDSVEKALLNRGFSVETVQIERSDFQDKGLIKQKLQRLNPLCVFNLFEGFDYESFREPEFVHILEDSGISYTGNSSHTLQICLDKYKAKDILNAANISVPKGILIKNATSIETNGLSLPLFVKPYLEDASLGIDQGSLVVNEQELAAVIDEKLQRFPCGLLVEEFIPGKEYNAGFMGRFPYELLDISVIDYSKHRDLPPFLTYDAKWNEQSREYKQILPLVGAQIPASLQDRILSLSIKAGELLGCRSYFRVYLREKNGRIYVLDVNPNPDISKDSGFIKQAYYKGHTYEDVIERILHSALS